MATDMTELHQIYYHESHLEKIFPFAIPYYNEGLTIFFENEPISKLVLSTKADKIGVTSWKLQEKMRKRVGLRQPLTQQALESDYQVLSFTRNSARHGMLAMANTWHPHFLTTIKLLWEKLGYKMPGEAKNPVYQNAFCSRTDIYKRYVNEFLIPGMDLCLKDEELNQKVMIDSGYQRLQRGSDVKSVKDKLGLDFYPLCPFIFERCPSLWFGLHNINVTYL
jgi:hypothetical protein